ncbi:FAD-binding oxidoreductase [Treponema sp.]|uniref:NAD(P)/FAD-dependent oxidoreductase n=1 Tax=Treponema sp. TaxID=166 RepID=UPI0025F1BF54|nr:FAD-binding oxidoreductase [Treponema sp.]MCR5217496.1 FAD-binding oxidoreductase [Treponema sp.]
MMTKADVIVIGAGIVGNATAYYLAKKGKKVIVLEASDYIGNGGSSRNGGGVRQSGRNPKELPLMIWGVKNIWPGLSEELGVDTEYTQGGNLRLGKTEEHLKILQKLADGANKCGVEVNMIDAAEVKKINPYMSDEVIGASWCPTDGHANPLTTTLGFYKCARALGADFITGAPVSKILTKAGKVCGVETPEQIFEADTVVVAAGYESNAILSTVGINIPMKKHALTCLVTEAEPQMFKQMLGTAMADFYGHQTKHGSFVMGGTDGFDEVHPRIDDSYPLIGSSMVSATSRGILGYFPVLKDAKVVRAWGGYGDFSVDGVATVSKCDEVPGLYIECGFTGHGFGIGPAAAFNIAELITTGQCPADISPLRYNRFKPFK